MFVATRNDKAAWVEAGRAYERFALQATALDTRNAFINQPIEVPSVRVPFESWLKLSGEHAPLLVRFGHGPRAPSSPRRPVDDVIMRDQPVAAGTAQTVQRLLLVAVRPDHGAALNGSTTQAGTGERAGAAASFARLRRSGMFCRVTEE